MRLTAAFLDKQPQLFDEWSSQNPLGRLGRPDELRGVITWLASDASTGKLKIQKNKMLFYYNNILLYYFIFCYILYISGSD